MRVNYRYFFQNEHNPNHRTYSSHCFNRIACKGLHQLYKETVVVFKEKHVRLMKTRQTNLRFWTVVHITTFGMCLLIITMFLVWNWFVLIVVLMVLVVNIVAYSKKMDSLAENHSPQDLYRTLWKHRFHYD